ncbi:polyphosphate kinase [Sagittula marina]|uniref:Polyphosphate kinase n=2 Tax=Sagittula marina TaxID=943940 RepID=A0A7W6DR33_9RHOB|nr:polyphosphate kinase [Sagittula marina]
MRILITLLAAVTLVTSLPSRTEAHPHVFVDVTGSFVLNDSGQLEAVRIHWLYDAFTTLMVIQNLGLDPDRDGTLYEADLNRIIEGETDWAPDYEGDTYLHIDGEKVRLSRPQKAWAEAPGDQIGVGFTLSLGKPIDMTGRTATLELYDPIYYYAYTVTDKSAVEGPAGACRFEIIHFDPDEEIAKLQDQLRALSREEIPDDPNVGGLFAETLELTCP